MSDAVLVLAGMVTGLLLPLAIAPVWAVVNDWLYPPPSGCLSRKQWLAKLLREAFR